MCLIAQSLSVEDNTPDFAAYWSAKAAGISHCSTPSQKGLEAANADIDLVDFSVQGETAADCLLCLRCNTLNS
jgi:hypothetical protein